MEKHLPDSKVEKGRPITYYTQARPEVAALIPSTCRRIVDVGCGAGELGALLKRERPGVEIRGIEPIESTAEKARTKLDDVHWGQADDPLPESWPIPDCLIFSDVLEHLVDPWETLHLWYDRLAPGGFLVISIPNVGHKSIISGLLRGKWNYSQEGILDRTHLRFFTRDSAIDLVLLAGFHLLSVESAHHTHWLTRAFKRLENNRRSGWLAGVLRFLSDLDTTQFVMVAQKRESTVRS